MTDPTTCPDCGRPRAPKGHESSFGPYCQAQAGWDPSDGSAFDCALHTIARLRAELATSESARAKMNEQLDRFERLILELQEKLATANAELERGRSPWVPVEERLPEIGTLVAAYNGAIWDAWLRPDGRWRLPSTGNICNLEGVTHWAALPDPPKGDKESEPMPPSPAAPDDIARRPDVACTCDGIIGGTHHPTCARYEIDGY